MKTISDIDREEMRLASAKDIDVENELLNTILPLMKSLAEETAENFQELAATLEELVDDVEALDDVDAFDPELAANVISTMRLGADLLSKLLPDENLDPQSEIGQGVLTYYTAVNKLSSELAVYVAGDEDDDEDLIDDIEDEDLDEDEYPQEEDE